MSISRYLSFCLLAILCTGCGSFLITPVTNSNELDQVQVKSGGVFNGSKIAIVEVEGLIANAKSSGFLQPTENPVSLFVQELDAAADDSSVKAVVLRVNSPGGTVTASDLLYQELLRFKAKTHKPVVASAQEVCASGAFYVSCGADRIVAQPTSILGSIGVIFNTLDLTDAMAKLGLRSETIKDEKGTYKDLGSPFHHMTDDERKVMQAMVEEDFSRFQNVVATNRHPPDLAAVTNGQVFSGERAKDLGLVDQVGLLDDAIATAKDMAHAPGASVVMYKRPYGYEGSIYAESHVNAPQAQAENRTLTINLPGNEDFIPTGLYYLWRP
jgi:protease-4